MGELKIKEGLAYLSLELIYDLTLILTAIEFKEPHFEKRKYVLHD
jgi:hypothetical protein